MTKNNLQHYLDHKTLYYDKIDYSMIQQSWDEIKQYIKLPYVIHLVGTNGKGSTGRYIASLLEQSQKSVLHYSSPHILQFNERIWIDGKNSANEQLEQAHMFLQKHLTTQQLDILTYFEYTTLLALVLSDKKEYLVLEAGLGGEFDATNVVKNDLSVFTPIGYDHQDFLGNTIEEIATTKMKSCDTSYILASQKYHEVETVKNEVLKHKKQIVLKDIKPECDITTLPHYLQENFIIALNVMEYLGFRIFHYTLPHLKGRFEYLKENIIIDVGHNTLAAQAIAHELQKSSQKFILIYNSYNNKDFKGIFAILKPYIKEVQIIPVVDDRIIETQILYDALSSLDISVQKFDIMNMQEKNNYLVFGSFLVVEQFLKGIKKHEKR
jgi:dihydrofolate synthase/folylpolyglutamate synthase